MSDAAIMPMATDTDGACRTLGIGKTKLYEEINAGRLVAKKCGTKTLLPTEQFAGWLAALDQMKPARAA